MSFENVNDLLIFLFRISSIVPKQTVIESLEISIPVTFLIPSTRDNCFKCLILKAGQLQILG